MLWSWTRRKKQQTETVAIPTRLGRCFVGVVVWSALFRLFEYCSSDDRSEIKGEQESRNKPTREVKPRTPATCRATARSGNKCR